MEENILHVPLESVHIALGAKMVPFAGYLMPVRYSSDLDEHNTVRNAVGVFDVSHMGEFLVNGEGSMDFLQSITTNDVSSLSIGKVQYSCLTNDKGGIIDDLLVYKLDENKYLLVVNASNIEKDWNWIYSHRTDNVQLENVSDNYCLLAIQGPKASEALQRMCSDDVTSMEYYTCKNVSFKEFGSLFVSATGYTGSGGYEVMIPNDKVVSFWNQLFSINTDLGIKPIGLGARDTLRLEKGYCLYGNDITDETTPLEAGLGWVTKFTKTFTASTILENQKKEGVRKKLVGIKMIEKGIPRSHYSIVDSSGNKIGEVTSGTQSPTLGYGIAMAYIDVEHSKVGTNVWVDIRSKNILAEVVKFPFV